MRRSATPDLPAEPYDDEMLLHRSLLRAFFVRRLRSADEADDCVQEVYARVLASKDPGKIRNWRGFLLRAASNLLTDRSRRDAVRHRGQHVPLDFAPELPDDRSPEQIVSQREELQMVRDVLMELDPVCRAAYALARFEGMAHKDIARCLDITPVMVGRHIERATILLVRRLQAHRT